MDLSLFCLGFILFSGLGYICGLKVYGRFIVRMGVVHGVVLGSRSGSRCGSLCGSRYCSPNEILGFRR